MNRTVLSAKTRYSSPELFRVNVGLSPMSYYSQSDRAKSK